MIVRSCLGLSKSQVEATVQVVRSTTWEWGVSWFHLVTEPTWIDQNRPLIRDLFISTGKTPNNSFNQNDVEAENTGSNSRGNSESGGGRQDSDRKPTEPDEESGLEDELIVLDSEDERNGDKDRSDEPAENNESRAAKEYDMISLSSDDEDDLPESSTVTSANLTVVYGVEYLGPDECD